MGIHTGPVQRVEDINANRNVAGGGINLAQRVMDCGDAGHILVTRTVAEVIGEIATWKATLHDLGEAEVKHGVRLHIYNLYTPEAGNAQVPHRLRAAAKRRLVRRAEAAGVVILLIFGILAGYFRTHGIKRYAVAPVKGRRSVAVLGFKNFSGTTQTAWLSTALSEMLTTELAAGEKLRAIPGENVARMKIDLSLPDTDSLAQDTLQSVYKNLGSDLVVVGSYLDVGGQIRIDLHLQDATKGETLIAVSEAGSEAQLLDVVNRAGAELRSKCGAGEITAGEISEIKAALPSNPAATRLYAEGLAKLRLFDALGARDLLEKAIATDPNYALAHSALVESWIRLGYDEKAKKEAKRTFELSAGLSQEERLLVEGRYHESLHDWPEAIRVYGDLFHSAPDNIDFGLHLVSSQRAGDSQKDALATLKMLRALPNSGNDPRIDLAESSVFADMGNFQNAASLAARVVQKGEAQQARLLVAQALRQECWNFENLGEAANALAACDKAMHIYQSLGDQNGVARALLLRAETLFDEGKLAEGKSTVEQANTIYRELGNRGGMAEALNVYGNVLSRHGDFREAGDTFRKAHTIYVEVGDRLGAAGVLDNLGMVLQAEGDLGSARRVHEEAIVAYRQMYSRPDLGLAINNLAWTLILQGYLKKAKDLLIEAEQIEREAGQKIFLGIVLNNIGDVLFAQDDVEGAELKYEEAETLFNQSGSKIEAARLQVDLIRPLVEKGKSRQAEVLLRQAQGDLAHEKLTDDQVYLDAALAETMLAEGKLTEAKKEIDRAAGMVSKTLSQGAQIKFGIAAARVRAASGLLSEAIKSLEPAIGSAKLHAFFGYELDARLALGEIELKSGRTAVGRAHLFQLEKEAKAKGFNLIARKAGAAAKGSA
jgi:eukaryotic-like serine/threonine-protein kinase